jgi:hypothetical protein
MDPLAVTSDHDEAVRDHEQGEAWKDSCARSRAVRARAQRGQGPGGWTPNGRPDYLRQQVEMELRHLAVAPFGVGILDDREQGRAIAELTFSVMAAAMSMTVPKADGTLTVDLESIRNLDRSRRVAPPGTGRTTGSPVTTSVQTAGNPRRLRRSAWVSQSVLRPVVTSHVLLELGGEQDSIPNPLAWIGVLPTATERCGMPPDPPC